MKLIRDSYPEIFRTHKESVPTRMVSSLEEHISLLVKKVMEEEHELMDVLKKRDDLNPNTLAYSEADKACYEEAADVLECLYELARIYRLNDAIPNYQQIIHTIESFRERFLAMRLQERGIALARGEKRKQL